jgi:septum site-determining protein MinC
MTETAPTVAPETPFELKAASFTLPVLKLLDTDVKAIAAGLSAKIAEAPQFFRSMPLVVDVAALAAQNASLNFALLLGTLRGKGLVPVGLSGGNEALNEMATGMELAILSNGAPRREPPTGKRSTPARQRKGRLISQPVRSGQRVYAADGDLTLLGPVSSGAEVFADGNVHVYGSLRGRALAGIQGDRKARIFCSHLDAELVSVAGIYSVSEDIDPGLRGRPAQIYLDDRRLRIEAL